VLRLTNAVILKKIVSGETQPGGIRGKGTEAKIILRIGSTF